MASVPLITQLRPEDYPGLGRASQGETDRLFRAINTALQGFSSALSGGLTIGQNSSAFLKTVTVTTPASAVLTPGTNWTIGASVLARGRWAPATLTALVTASGVGPTVATLPTGWAPAQTVPLTGVVNATGAGLGTVGFWIDSGGNIGQTGAAIGTAYWIAGSWDPGALASPPINFSFKNTLSGNPAGVQIVAARDVTNQRSPIPVALDGVAWTTSRDQIVISDIVGLSPSRSYSITFLVWGG